MMVRYLNMSDNLKGICWIIFSSACFTLMTVYIKMLSGVFSLPQVIFFRFLFAFVPLVIFIHFRGWYRIKTDKMKWHFLRSIVGFCAALSGFYALKNAPLAEVSTLNQTIPLFMPVWAMLFLGEKIYWRRRIATITGFIGALIIFRPGFEDPNFYLFFALLFAFLISISLTLVKHLTRTEDSLGMIFHLSTFIFVFSGLPMIFLWQMPNTDQWILMILSGLYGFGGQVGMVQGYKYAEASVAAPIGYITIPFSFLAGVWFFDEVIDTWLIAGASLIIASMLYLAYREEYLRRKGRT